MHDKRVSADLRDLFVKQYKDVFLVCLPRQIQWMCCALCRFPLSLKV